MTTPSTSAQGTVAVTREMAEAGRKAIADERARVGMQYPDTLAVLAYQAMAPLAPSPEALPAGGVEFTGDLRRRAAAAEAECRTDDADALITAADIIDSHYLMIASLQDQLSAAIFALRPFADAIEGNDDPKISDGADIWEAPLAMNITYGHLRAAALSSAPAPEDRTDA